MRVRPSWNDCDDARLLIYPCTTAPMRSQSNFYFQRRSPSKDGFEPLRSHFVADAWHFPARSRKENNRARMCPNHVGSCKPDASSKKSPAPRSLLYSNTTLSSKTLDRSPVSHGEKKNGEACAEEQSEDSASNDESRKNYSKATKPIDAIPADNALPPQTATSLSLAQLHHSIEKLETKMSEGFAELNGSFAFQIKNALNAYAMRPVAARSRAPVLKLDSDLVSMWEKTT